MSLVLTTSEAQSRYRPVTCVSKAFSLFYLFHLVHGACVQDMLYYQFRRQLYQLFLASIIFCLMVNVFFLLFLCCPTFCFGVSTVSVSSNILATSDIIFITYPNHHHMTNNMTYTGNNNARSNTSVIIFLIDSFAIIVKDKGGVLSYFQTSFSSLYIHFSLMFLQNVVVIASAL